MKLSTDGKNHTFLKSFDILICLFSPRLFHPVIGVSLQKYSGCYWKETIFPNSVPHSFGSWELIYLLLSFFPHNRSPHWIVYPNIVSSWGRSDIGKVLLLLCSNDFYLVLTPFWNLLLGRLAFYKFSLPLGICSGQNSTDFLQL